MTNIQGLVKQAYKTGPGAPLQPEHMIALLQAVAQAQGDGQQMAWLSAEYPAVYDFIASVDQRLLLRGRTDPTALQDAAIAIAGKIEQSLDKMRWDDLGLSPSYEAAARRLFPRRDWTFIQDLPNEHGVKEPRFIMEEDAYRPLIPGQMRLDQQLFDWDMKNDLEGRLEKLGVTQPDVGALELGSFLHRLTNDYLHVPPEDAALLMDAKALATRGARLGDGAQGWTFARRREGNQATIPVEFALGMRGVAYGLPDQEPETVRMACANRIAQRLSSNENAVVRSIDGVEKIVVPNPNGEDTIGPPLNVTLEEIDGRTCIVCPTDDARVLLAPIALGDPAAKFSMKRQTFDPQAKGFHGENAVFLVQAAKLAYEDAETIGLYTDAWGLRDASLVDHRATDGQAFVAYDEERNTVVVAFRGTESRADIFVDADFGLERSDYFPEMKVHGGFLGQFVGLMPELQAKVEALQESAKAEGKPPPSVMVGGHSLGGALASMYTYWGLKNSVDITQTYTCGQPSWANEVAAKDFEDVLSKSGCNLFRFVNNNDIVPRVPPSCHHCGTELYIDHQGKIAPPGVVQVWERTKDRLAGIVDNWSTSNGIDVVDSVSDHYVDFYLGYARKNRAVSFALDAASGIVGAAMGAAANVIHTAADVARAVVPGGDDGRSP